MRIVIMGAGAVGGYFGGRLAATGHDVWFIARGAQLGALREGGLRVESINGDFSVTPAQATDQPSEVGPVDLVIVSVKTWQLADAARQMSSLVDPDTTVLPLLNGVEAAGDLARALPGAHVLGGLCRILAHVEAPGLIEHTGVDPIVIFGELDDHPSAKAESIREAFQGSGVRAEIASDIQAALWKKFMLIATWSGIGAITRAPVGIWRRIPETRALADASLHETSDVARAIGVGIDSDLASQTMTFIDGIPPRATTSMQRDIAQGRPSELEAQNGAVVRLGAEAGVPTPTHSFVYGGLLPQERAARAELRGEAEAAR